MTAKMPSTTCSGSGDDQRVASVVLRFKVPGSSGASEFIYVGIHVTKTVSFRSRKFFGLRGYHDAGDQDLSHCLLHPVKLLLV